FEAGTAVFGPEAERPPRAAAGRIAVGEEVQRVVRWVLDHARPAGLGTETMSHASVACFPIRSAGDVYGAIVLMPYSRRPLDVESRTLLEAFCLQVAFVTERARFAEEAKVAAVRAKDEQTKSALLSAV